MATDNNNSAFNDELEDDDDFDEFDDLELLDRLESLREDMEELGIRTLDELNKRIQELHEKLDEE